MPEKMTAYRCAHKCGRKILANRKEMVEHEKRCFYNPSTKSCKTCIHSENDEGYYCLIDKLPEGKAAVTNCGFWEQEETRP